MLHCSYNCSYISLFRCDGEYTLVIHQSGMKPRWIYRRNAIPDGVVRYGYLKGIPPDIVAYATQASEAAFLRVIGTEIKMLILKENFNQSDDLLYIGFDREQIAELRKCVPNLPNNKVTYKRMKVEFEVRHHFFDSLIRSVSGIHDDNIKRLLPNRKDFPQRLKDVNIECTRNMQQHIISQLDHGDQRSALKTIATCPRSSPPVLINGSFGTGKSRVLAIAACYIVESAKPTEPARVLVCAHHQASADYFVETYFGEMMQRHLWSTKHFFRVTSPRYYIRSEKLKEFSQYYLTVKQLEKKLLRNSRICDGNLVIATTYHTAHRLSELFSPGFFTNILMDEGAQCREAEAIAPLSLASRTTQIVIAGDSKQVTFNLKLNSSLYCNNVYYLYTGWASSSCSWGRSSCQWF